MERKQRTPEPKHLRPEVLGDFAAWRIRPYSIPGGISLSEESRQRQRMEEEKRRGLLIAKPQTIRISEHENRESYMAIAGRYQELTGRHPGKSIASFITHQPYFFVFLEPLSEDEVSQVGQSSVDSVEEPIVIIRAEELRRIIAQ